MTEQLTIGRRVAWYRRRRGMTQQILADVMRRTVDWVSKVENDRIPVDRLSVIAELAEALDVTIGDLLAEPSLMDWTRESGSHTIPALRNALLDYRQITPLFGGGAGAEPPSLDELRHQLSEVMDAYQASRYGAMTRRLPGLLAHADAAAEANDDARSEQAVLALSYQAAAAVLTKLGEGDLAWIAADRGLVAARRSGDPVIVGSLFRSVAHTLLATGRFKPAVQLTEEAAAHLQPGLGSVSSWCSGFASVAARRAATSATSRGA
jgi:transcriptional regulator with XRE-family HTH domain